MSDEALAFILQSDNLDIDEYDLLLAVRSWATVNAVSYLKILSWLKVSESKVQRMYNVAKEMIRSDIPLLCPQMNFMCCRNTPTNYWCIMADIPKTRINNPNVKKFGNVAGHQL